MFAKLYTVEGTAQVLFYTLEDFEGNPVVKLITKVDGITIEAIRRYPNETLRDIDFEHKFDAVMATEFFHASKNEISQMF